MFFLKNNIKKSPNYNKLLNNAKEVWFPLIIYKESKRYMRSLLFYLIFQFLNCLPSHGGWKLLYLSISLMAFLATKDTPKIAHLVGSSPFPSEKSVCILFTPSILNGVLLVSFHSNPRATFPVRKNSYIVWKSTRQIHI